MWYRKKIASPTDEGMSNFGYKDIISTGNEISEKELLDNIKDFYIKQVTEHELINNDVDPQFLADFIEELNLMWEEYIEDFKNQDDTAIKQITIIASDYMKSLPESKEKEMLGKLLSSQSSFQDLVGNS